MIKTENEFVIKPIAHIENGFTSKFGIPRQSGIVNTTSKIVFEPQYRSRDALRGLEGYSHLWLIWRFSEAKTEGFSPTVRPPKLGGNIRMGVFATRSPFRPNSLGLSCVKIKSVDLEAKDGPVISVLGADLLSGTEIFDIKPYVAYSDSHPEALGGFSVAAGESRLTVEFPPELCKNISEKTKDEITAVLREDPRPGYQDDESREYYMAFSGYEIGFRVKGEILTVTKTKHL